VAEVWCDVDGGLVRKIAAALVLKMGAIRMGFYRGNTPDVLRKDTCWIVSPNRTRNQ
jgi:hypothetical protein